MKMCFLGCVILYIVTVQILQIFSSNHVHSKQKQATNNTHQIVTYQTLTQDERSHNAIDEESSHLEHDAMRNGK